MNLSLLSNGLYFNRRPSLLLFDDTSFLLACAQISYSQGLLVTKSITHDTNI